MVNSYPDDNLEDADNDDAMEKEGKYTESPLNLKCTIHQLNLQFQPKTFSILENIDIFPFFGVIFTKSEIYLNKNIEVVSGPSFFKIFS